eukprot:1615161-Prymnesium_polylepis.1
MAGQRARARVWVRTEVTQMRGCGARASVRLGRGIAKAACGMLRVGVGGGTLDGARARARQQVPVPWVCSAHGQATGWPECKRRWCVAATMDSGSDAAAQRGGRRSTHRPCRPSAWQHSGWRRGGGRRAAGTRRAARRGSP